MNGYVGVWLYMFDRGLGIRGGGGRTGDLGEWDERKKMARRPTKPETPRYTHYTFFIPWSSSKSDWNQQNLERV
jgi:hypothetical protein